MEIRTGDEVFGAFFPDGEPTVNEPRGAAFIWWEALRGKTEFLDVLHALTVDPSLWGDYHQAAEILRGHGMMQFVERCPGDADIAYIKFMPNAEHATVGFAAAPIHDAKILTLFRCTDGIWRVWGLSPSRFPSAREVRGP
jgi:hypothetical protein